MSALQTKPDLALIHGWGLGSSAWQTLLPALAPHFCLHLVSLPGYGHADHPPEGRMDRSPSHGDSQKANEPAIFRHTLCTTPSHEPSNTPTFDEAAQSLIETLPEGCIVCGWSLGSMLALRAEGCDVVGEPQHSEQGKFGWVMDPEGNKVELWEPPAGQ